MPPLDANVLAAGGPVVDELARAIIARFPTEVAAGDLSALRVVVPSLGLAAEVRSALVRALPGSALLPAVDTLARWVEATGDDLPGPLPASERLVLLHGALRLRGWFDERALWGIAGELALLFDELTAASVALPADAEELAAQLESAYALRGSSILAFEARVVHELWHALVADGRPDAPAAYRLRLARLGAQAAAAAPGSQALVVLLAAPPEEALEAAELKFLAAWRERQPLLVFQVAPRESEATPGHAVLAAAWPATDAAPPLAERARALREAVATSPFAGRLRIVATSGRESEARAAAAEVGAWLSSGLRRIVLIAQDRLTARRVRALLERENVLVADETGWTLSTSRAAACIDALLETAQGDAYHRDLLDLVKSPYVPAGLDECQRRRALDALEAALRRASVKAGLGRIRRCVAESASEDRPSALALLERVESAVRPLRGKPATLARWLDRLMTALAALGGLEPLATDAAGRVLLDVVERRRAELGGRSEIFSFDAWREWLDREFEAATFRDASIASSIVMTSLGAAGLRGFEAALLLGGDATLLAPAEGGRFFNPSVRRDLGLPTRSDGERRLRRELETLLLGVPRVTVLWQSEDDGEARLLAPELALLSTLHALAWGSDLQEGALPARGEPLADPATAPGPTRRAAAVVAPALIPHRVSVSGLASLVACPYQFFARSVLRLGELDEVSEEMDKRGYGELVHRALERFHADLPSLGGISDEAALARFEECVDAVFAPAIADDFLANGWRLRWQRRLPAYLAWQRRQEDDGWRFAEAEQTVSVVLAAGEGGTVELHGRIDRVDRSADGQPGVMLIDYKAKRASALERNLADDVQLPAYALMRGDARRAAYVALDDDEIVARESVGGADLMAAATAQGERLGAAFAALRAGAALPAHGVDAACAWCQMGGLCRREHVADA